MLKSDQELARRIEKDHEDLKSSISRIEVIFDQQAEAEDFSSWKIDLLWQLRDFLNQLQKHFDLEEDGGYNTDLVLVAPHLAPQVAHLEEDHRKITSDLNHILDIVKRIDNERSSMLPRVRERIDSSKVLISHHLSLAGDKAHLRVELWLRKLGLDRIQQLMGRITRTRAHREGNLTQTADMEVVSELIKKLDVEMLKHR